MSLKDNHIPSREILIAMSKIAIILAGIPKKHREHVLSGARAAVPSAGSKARRIQEILSTLNIEDREPVLSLASDRARSL